MKRLSISNITILVATGTLISRILGFGRELVLAYKFGASIESDIFLVAITIPMLLFQSIGVSFSTAMIPIESTIENNEESKKLFHSSLMTYTFIISSILSIIGVFYSEQVIKIFTPGFEQNEITLAANLLKLTFPITIFSMLSAVTSGFLMFINKYYVVTFSQIIYNLALILMLFLSDRFGIRGIAFGALFGYIIIFVMQIKKCFSHGFSFAFSMKVSKYIQKFFFVIFPISLVTFSQQIGSFVDRYLASNMTGGTIAALNYADRLYLLPYGIIIMAISTVYYPGLVKLNKLEEKAELKNQIHKLLSLCIIIIIPILIFLYIFKFEIVSFVYQRGSFSNDDVITTSTALGFYVLGMIGLSTREIFLKLYFSIEDNKTPMINSAIMVVINIFSSIFLSRYIGYAGLALGTSISISVSSLLLMVNAYKKGFLNLKLQFLLRIFLITMTQLIVSILIHNINFINKLCISSFTQLLIHFMLSIVIYFIILTMLNFNGLRNIILTKLRLS